MRYHVRFVNDSELPGDVDFVFARLDDETFLFIKRSACDPTAPECEALTRAFDTWERAQSVELKELAGAL